jgi:hypothetical protein
VSSESIEHGVHGGRILLADHDIHANGPVPLIGDRATFYCILFRHQHCQLIRKSNVVRNEPSMIWERVRRNLDAVLLEGCEELLWMADSCDGMHPAALKGVQRTRFAADERNRFGESRTCLDGRVNRRQGPRRAVAP